MVSPAAIRKNPSAPPFPTGFPTDRAGPLWLQSVWLWLALCALAALPIWMCAGVPPLVDLGGHLGRYAIQIDGGRSADLAQWYDFHWALLPNLGVDLLVELLAPHFGLETALRGIVMAIPVIAVGGWLVLTRTVHGRLSPFALFALPLAYSYPFEFGFVNFCLATALAGWALALWIALGQRGAIGWRWLVFVPIACALWLCHLVGWFIFCLFAAADEWVRLRDRGGTRGLALAHLALALSGLMAPWLIVAALVHAPAAHEPSTDWFNVPDKLGQLLMGLRDCWMAWDLPSALLQCALIGWAWRSARFSRHRGLALGVIWLALVYAVIPGTVAGSSRADMRLVPTLIAMALIAIAPPRPDDRRMAMMLACAGLAFVTARFAGNAASMVLFDRQFGADLAVLDRIPARSSLISLAVEPCHQTFLPWRRARRSHLGGYAIARRHDFSNDQWTRAGVQLVSVHNPAAGRFETDTSELAHEPDCGDAMVIQRVVKDVPRHGHYLWIIWDGVERAIPGWRPVARSPGSVVYAPA